MSVAFSNSQCSFHLLLNASKRCIIHPNHCVPSRTRQITVFSPTILDIHHLVGVFHVDKPTGLKLPHSSCAKHLPATDCWLHPAGLAFRNSNPGHISYANRFIVWSTSMAEPASFIVIVSYLLVCEPYMKSHATSQPRTGSRPIKPKFHYASWFGAEIWPIIKLASSELARASRFAAKFHYARWFGGGSNQIA